MFPIPWIKHPLLIAVASVALALMSAGFQPGKSAFGDNGAEHGHRVQGSAPASPEAREAANSIFAERCAVCHGDDGGGAGPGAANLNPKPQNFRSRKWQKSMSDQQIAMIIVNGGSSAGLSASMDENPDLEGQPDVVAALVERIRKFAK